jgi:chorismate mutase
MKKTLEDLRKEIDTVDEEVIKILSKRFAIVRKIGKLKQEQKKQPLDEKRWKDVIQKIAKKAKEHNIPEETLIKIYNEIHNAALSLENNHE